MVTDENNYLDLKIFNYVCIYILRSLLQNDAKYILIYLYIIKYW